MWKRLELLGRRLLVHLAGWLWGRKHTPVTLSDAPRILVVRIDSRVGNLVLLTPLLASLRARFPKGRIEILAAPLAQDLLAGHPAVDHLLIFRKRPWLGSWGALRVHRHLQERRYDLAIDAGNPTDPSLTGAVLVARSGAQHTVGVGHGPFARLYSAPAPVGKRGPHEVTLRGAVLDVLPGVAEQTAVGLPRPSLISSQYIILNVGSGRSSKRPSVQQWSPIVAGLYRSGRTLRLVFGPGEQALAESLAKAWHGRAEVQLAPPTDLAQLRDELARARGVVTPDSGPMHLAVAMGVPTLGVFLSTDPARYGYADPPHQVLDLRAHPAPELEARVERWARGIDG